VVLKQAVERDVHLPALHGVVQYGNIGAIEQAWELMRPGSPPSRKCIRIKHIQIHQTHLVPEARQVASRNSMRLMRMIDPEEHNTMTEAGAHQMPYDLALHFAPSTTNIGDHQVSISPQDHRCQVLDQRPDQTRKPHPLHGHQRLNDGSIILRQHVVDL